MGQLIKQFPDGSFLEYDRGGFDDWCVYLTDASGNRKPPRDTDYFTQLRNLAEKTPTVDAQGLYEIPIETAYRVRVDVVSVSGGYVSVYGQFANTAV